MYIFLYGLVREINTAAPIKIREAMDTLDERNFKLDERAMAKHKEYRKRK